MTGRPFPRLSRAFFERPTQDVSRQLLGQRLVHLDAGMTLAGYIFETEAYIGPEDLASHARHGITERNKVMWGRPGHAYVYFTYGMHWMLNFVTERDGQAGAALLRAILPSEGMQRIRSRRPPGPDASLCDGPAKITQALGVDKQWNGHDLCDGDSRLFIEACVEIPDGSVITGPRVGLNRVPEPWKSKPWRYRIEIEELQRVLEETDGNP